MRTYTEEEIDEMREHLADAEWEGLKDKDLRQALWEGCVGWTNIPDEDVISHYVEIYGEAVNGI
jgi:hypothetical protein